MVFYSQVDATQHAWFWLGLSGIIGFVLGDLFLFASYPIISFRVAMLVMTLAPPFAAILGWAILGGTMSGLSILGMFVVISGISLAIWSKPKGDKKMKLNFSSKGLLFALLGTIGQAIGLVLSKLGMGMEYNAFAATQIRIIAGIVGFVILITILKRWGNIGKALKN